MLATLQIIFFDISFNSSTKDVLYKVADLFPSLGSIRLEEPSKDVSQALATMSSVETLTLSCYAWTTINEAQMCTSLENLKVLTLRNSAANRSIGSTTGCTI